MDADLSPLGTQLSYSATIVWMLQMAKQCPRLKFINDNSPEINRALALVASAIAAFGVHASLNGTFATGSVLTLAIPPAAQLIGAFGHWFQSFVTQEMIYQVTRDKDGKVGAKNG